MNSDVNEYIESLKASRKFGPQVVCHKRYSSCEAQYGRVFPRVSPLLQSCLDQIGVNALYSHQCQAIELILQGQNVVVATPTASGKSIIYNLPVINDFLGLDPGYSLYLFPLKALAQDQFNGIKRLFEHLPKSIAEKTQNFASLYDGDTSAYARRKIRNSPPRVLISNPEMVHLSLLPYHANWAQFFGKLRYIVIDEVHSYRGVIGSHMAWVIRRLLRIADHYGAHPTFILLSATIGNPGELCRTLIDRPVSVISESGAPRAAKNMIFLNPWDSAAHTASQLLEAAVKRGLRTIVYTQSRKMTELINLWTAPRLGHLAPKLSAYRAGFLAEERREIEQMLFSGKLLGVISTSALELGIDIGDLDLCILVGYPGSIMATWQRGGRVGRGIRDSATILIGQEDALDQHFMRQPEDFFRRPPEAAVLNPYNDSIIAQHLLCCGDELPLSLTDQFAQNPAIREKITSLSRSGDLLETASGGLWISARKNPQRHISLRGGGRQLTIIDRENGEIIGEIDATRGMKECHPGAAYLHRSTFWIVDKFELEQNEILAHRETPHYYTRAMSEKRTEILEVLEVKNTGSIRVSLGRVKVREKVTGFQKRNNHSQKLIATTPLDLPEQIIESEGLWLDIPQSIVDILQNNKLHFMGAIHALEHALIALFPLFVLCDRNDIGGISCPFHEQTEMATVFIYDGYPGGVGLAREAFLKIDDLLAQALQTISLCGCETGCPSCVHSPKCGSGNRPIDKQACIFLLNEILRNNAPALQLEDQSKPIAPRPTAQNYSNKTDHSNQPSGLSVLPAKFGVFDLETIRSAEEVGGWHNAHLMGVSVAVVYDSECKNCVTYLEHEMDKFLAHLLEFDLIVGFNNKKFDNRVLSAYSKVDLNQLPSLDLLEEIYCYLGYRLSLNSLAEHTLGKMKSADGLKALQWYKEGKIDLIQQYCRKDVEITRDLFFYSLDKGYLLFVNKAKQKVRLPLALDSTIRKILTHGQRRGPKTHPVVPLA